MRRASRTQLDWRAAAEVREALFTHCGSQIVAGDEDAAADRVRALGRAAGVQAGIAIDLLELRVHER